MAVCPVEFGLQHFVLAAKDCDYFVKVHNIIKINWSAIDDYGFRYGDGVILYPYLFAQLPYFSDELSDNQSTGNGHIP